MSIRLAATGATTTDTCVPITPRRARWPRSFAYLDLEPRARASVPSLRALQADSLTAAPTARASAFRQAAIGSERGAGNQGIEVDARRLHVHGHWLSRWLFRPDGSQPSASRSCRQSCLSKLGPGWCSLPSMSNNGPVHGRAYGLELLLRRPALEAGE